MNADFENQNPSGAGPGRAAFAADTLQFEDVLEMYASFASSSLGKRALVELQPRSIEDARAALERVREMDHLFKVGDAPSLAGFTDPLPPGTSEARVLEEDRLVALRAFIDAGERLREWFPARAQETPSCAAVVASLPDLSRLRDEIDGVIDERGHVRRDASDLLGRLKREGSRLSESIDKRLREILNKGDVRNVLSDGSVHRRTGRPVLAVKARMSGRVRGIVHDRSQTDQTVFIEPREVIEMGNRLAEVRADERRETERILLELSRKVLDHSDAIAECARLLAEIELATISMRFCEAHAAVPALLPDDPDTTRQASPGLLLRGARHPLLIKQVAEGGISEVVPIDLRLGVDFDMLIITGPNTGGKTLALKTAGICALLTRCGLPIPALEGSTVPLYSGIAADIGDEQEISQNLSTFASHLVRIRDGLARAGEDTLVLLDELGGGTDPDEGAALGEAVLETLLALGAPTIVSTHLGKLKEFAFRHTRAENACTEFDIKTLAPLYHLQVGVPGESGALIIARRLGMPAAVVELAEQRLDRHEGELEALMSDVRKARTDAESVRTRAERQLDDVRQTRRDLDEKTAEVDRRGEQLEKEAQRGLEERVREAMRHLGHARSLLEQLPREVAGAMTQRLEALGKELSGASLTDRRQAFLNELSKGNLVYLPRYRQRCMVHRVDREGRKVTVKLGSMKMKVSFDEVTWYESL